MTKIMLVDDEPDIIFTTKMMLERENYEVVVAKSGKECLERLMKEKPDLVLLPMNDLGLFGSKKSAETK